MNSEFLTFSYWLWPNPGNLHYGDQKAMIAIGICVGFLVLAFALGFWRRKLQNSVTRKLSRSWSGALAWFGITGLVMVVSRVESILFLGMRALWVLWALSFVAYVLFQIVQFRRRHYTVIRQERKADERDKYMPGKNKR